MLNAKYIFGLLICFVAKSSFACTHYINPGDNILNKFNAAPAGAFICFTPGTYSLSTELVPKANQTIASSTRNAADVTINVSSSRAFVFNSSSTGSAIDNITFNGGVAIEFAILLFNANNVTVWAIKTNGFKIPIGVNNSSNSTIVGSDLHNNGGQSNGVAEPAIWTSDSDNIDIKWNTSYHTNFVYPAGDGEMSCYNSSFVTYEGNILERVGAGGIYLINCDDALVKDNTLHEIGEYGIDNPGCESNGNGCNSGSPGSQRVRVIGNHIDVTRNGAGVYFEDLNGAGWFEDNYFGTAFGSLHASICPGLRVRGNASNITFINNTTGSPSGPNVCVWTPY